MVGQSGCEAGMFCLFLSLWCHSSGVSKLKTWALWCSLHCVCSCRVKWTVSSPAAGTSNKEWSVSQQPDKDNKVGRKGGTGEQNTRVSFYSGEQSWPSIQGKSNSQDDKNILLQKYMPSSGIYVMGFLWQKVGFHQWDGACQFTACLARKNERSAKQSSRNHK